ncbi:MAG: Protein GrpE [candidate division WWE3 bacterium GW2011_GWA1_46_21]|uniref:Protein GrpE n=4 Tax=Katanobacteria TaxID=422282 RepID=A0A0G1PGU7_UNCKA|nr:MAG: Protein GrpE [candidate division WWE3 bacterium GW2011_GWA1_46_21]KKU48614.1 MAG: Protein GrpE [candidate division WWE3 bacterium GW2011_GWA2_46_9]KKU51430.1 MAG: Protein GrpE [candidate division WWE3 bacterium GW2011_GWC1_47_10]KKU57724.1 MAG: Protein GrpE [candidate division WWE3 bacterium GW2011_GWB1_47_11]
MVNTADDVNIHKDCEAKLDELENNWKRALADYKNLQRRVEEEKTAVVDFANFVLIARLLSVLDNLEMLKTHIDDVGLKLTVKEFEQILLDEGLTGLGVNVGDTFAHETMEAVDKDGDGDDVRVVEVVRKGYKLRDKVIRPARVLVKKG